VIKELTRASSEPRASLPAGMKRVVSMCICALSRTCLGGILASLKLGPGLYKMRAQRTAALRGHDFNAHRRPSLRIMNVWHVTASITKSATSETGWVNKPLSSFVLQPPSADTSAVAP
jgi:hypothetical protein